MSIFIRSFLIVITVVFASISFGQTAEPLAHSVSSAPPDQVSPATAGSVAPDASPATSATSTVLEGIDVSDYQGIINWPQVASAGKTFAFVKACGGLYSEQDKFTRNMDGAKAAGLKVGAYHFAYPGYTAGNTGTAEAQHFVRVAGKYLVAGYLRPVLDLEPVDGMNNPYTNYNRAQLSQWIRDFAGVIKSQYGVDIIIYCSRSYATSVYLEPDLSVYPYWVPTNDGDETGTPSLGIWTSGWAFKQYRFGNNPTTHEVTATCPGVPVDNGCDLDSFRGSLNDLNKYVIGQATTSSIVSVTPSPSSGTTATVGQPLNVQVQVAGTATTAGYLQVWLYDNTFTTSQKVGTYIGGPQSYSVNLTGFSLAGSAPSTQSYAIFTQFRPGATSGPLSSNQATDIQSSQTYTVNWQNPPAAPTVTTPTITAGGQYVASAQVSMYCSTYGATIYYTTDGNTPTAGSTVYSAPFSLTKSATVKAVAIESGYRDSSVASSSFMISPSSAGAALSLSTNQINNLSAGNGGASLLVYNSGAGVLSWSATTSTPWISIPTASGTAGSQGTSFQFAVQQNNGTTARTGTITVTAQGAAGSPQILTIKQYQNNPPVGMAKVLASPSNSQPGQGLSISCGATALVGQYVLFGASIYPAGQTELRFDDPANDGAITIAPGLQTISRGFTIPTNAPGGAYDVEVGIWVDNNGNGRIDTGDTLLGNYKAPNALTVSVTPPPNYTVWTTSTPGGGNVSGGGVFPSGTVATVVAQPNPSYTFAAWTEEGAQVSANAVYSFAVTSNRMPTANFTAAPVPPPQITSALAVGAQVGAPFSYQITASNGPSSFGAVNLPAGLGVDPATGVISGVPTSEGDYAASLTAANASGAGGAVLVISVAPAPLPSVRVKALDPAVGVNTGGRGRFQFIRTDDNLAQGLSVYYTMSGNAIAGVDYRPRRGVITFPPGQKRVELFIIPISDLGGRPSKKVRLTVMPGDDYNKGTPATAVMLMVND